MGTARALFDEPLLKGKLEIGAVNTETNAKKEDLDRAMMEAGDLNEWLGDSSVDIGSRLHLRTSSFCMAQGDQSDDGGFHQGMSAFAPHYTFLQPPGYVHSMISTTWQPNAISASVDYAENPPADHWGSKWNTTLTASAAASEDGKTVVVRAHSNASSPVSITVSLGTSARRARGLAPLPLVVESVVSASVLTAPSLQAVNSPSAPEAVAPKTLRVRSTV